MKYSPQLVFNLILHLLCGLLIASLSTLLIYFKQKPLLHHFVILFVVAAIYFGFYTLRSKTSSPPEILKVASLIILTIICWLSPQFIYQLRPYTFYITGFTIGVIVLTAISAQFLKANRSIFPWSIIILFTGYFIGLLIPLNVLHFVIIGFLFLIIIYYFSINPTGIKTKVIIILGAIICTQLHFQFSKSLSIYSEQTDYEDKVVFAIETQFHQLVVTQWQEDYWFFIDKLKNLCSIDEYLFYEPMVHSTMKITKNVNDVLVIGGENGCLVREVLKYNKVQEIDVVTYDTLLRKLGQENPIFTGMNEGALDNQKVNIIKKGLLEFVSHTSKKYEAIFIDLPDPRSIESNQYYTLEFYNFVKQLMTEGGVMVTQAGSPYFATQAFYTVGETLKEGGFYVLPIHNQILTLGEWGWYICSLEHDDHTMKKAINHERQAQIYTRWWNKEAAKMVTSFGITYSDTLNVGINTLDNPVLYQYYLKGNWDME